MILTWFLFAPLSKHRVEPQGDLRFAITARHIKEDMVDPRHLYMGRYTLPPGLAYNGQ